MNNKNLLFLLLLLCKPAYNSEPTKKIDLQSSTIKKQSFVEKWAPTMLTTIWAGGVGLESLCYLIPDVRHALYGPEAFFCEEFPTIRLSRPIWSALAGDIFANYDTVFVSKKAINSLFSDERLAKQSFATEALMSKNYDRNLLILSAVTPPIIWGLTHSLNYFIKKFKIDKKDGYAGKISRLVTQCKESFKAKVAITVSILGLFICYNRYMASSYVQKMFKS